jgi:hypothetical protein
MLIKDIDRVSITSGGLETLSEIYPFVFIIAVEKYLFVLLSIRKETLSTVILHLVSLKDLDSALHVSSGLKVEKESPFGIDVVCQKRCRDEPLILPLRKV